MSKRAVIIFHFVLEGISTAGSPPLLVYEYLKPFFTGAAILVYKEITISLPDDDAIADHTRKMAEMANEFSRCVYYSISTMPLKSTHYSVPIQAIWPCFTLHADDDRGDLFYCKEFSITVEEVRCSFLTCPVYI